MKLMELFSVNVGGPEKQEEEINWLDDLKFYIDNDDHALASYLFPAVNKHKQHKGHPDAYKLYVPGLIKCSEEYCKKFETESPAKELFPKDAIIELARHFAEKQNEFIEKGDYQ